MGGSRIPGSEGGLGAELVCSAETPGPQGNNDQSSSERMCLLGDSPGPTGENDLADSRLLECVDTSFANTNPNTGPTKTSDNADEDEDVEVYVFNVEKLLEWAKLPAGYAGSISDAKTLIQLFGEFGWKGVANDIRTGRVNFYIKNYNGKQYIVFKGYAGLRKIFTGTKYFVDNSKVLNMAIGKAGQIKSGVKGGILTAVFVVAVDIAQYFLDDEATLADLGVTLFSDLTKVAIASAIGTAAGALVATVATGAVIVPLAAAIAVGVVVSLGLDWIDEKFQLTARLKRWANRRWEEIQKEYANKKYEFNRWWNFLDSPEGYFWLREQFTR